MSATTTGGAVRARALVLDLLDASAGKAQRPNANHTNSRPTAAGVRLPDRRNVSKEEVTAVVMDGFSGWF
jgi:hypothetical protein